MRTKLSVCAASLAESAWLTALALVPVFFNPRSVRIFDEDKALLLRSLALLIAAAVIVWIIETGRPAFTAGNRSFIRLPLLRPALALTAVWLAATLASIDPWISFWGAYIRTQGLYTWLSYLMVFAALLLLVRERGQVERIVTVLLLSSVPAAIYGVCQHFGVDPIRWDIDTRARVISTAGNAIFIGAYMIMVVPLTLTRLIEQYAAVREPQTERVAGVVLLAAYGALLVLQVLTLVYSESRGPFLGLAAGLTCYFVIYAAHRRRRGLTALTVGAIAAAAVFLVVFNLPDTPIAAWRRLPYVGRLGQLLEVGGGTGKVRVLLWSGAERLLAAHPERLPLGHGPDTMFLAYIPFYPPELSYYEQRGVTPDRSHNESFDALIMTGCAGLAAGLIVYMAVFTHALAWLGMVSTRRQRACVIVAMIGGGTLGVLLPLLFDGSLRFAGVGLPVGVVLGMLAYVLVRAMLRAAPATPHRDDLLLIGLVSAIVAHFVEVHFGIAITVTRLYFWTYAALIVVLGMPLVRPIGADHAGANPVLRGERQIISLTVGLLLVLSWYGFVRRGIDAAAATPALIAVVGGTWLMGACLIGAEPDQRGSRLAGMAGYATLTTGLLLLFLGAFALWGDAHAAAMQGNAEVVRALGHRAVGATQLLCAFVLLLVFLQAVIQALRQETLPARWAGSAITAVVAVVLLATAVAIGVVTNVRPLQADVLAKQAQIAETRRQWQAARLLFEDARRLEPYQTTYAVGLGRVLTELARRAASESWSVREQALVRAQDVLTQAWQRMPGSDDHPRNLAKLERTWAALTADASRATHVQQAAELYRRAAELAPFNADLRNEWATLHLEHGDGAHALEVLSASITIDDRFARTFYLRAQARLALGDQRAALADYDAALSLDQKMLESWSGKALTLADLGDTAGAIAANERALAVAPNDVITQRNLALLWQRQGDIQRARAYAESALILSHGDDREKLEQFIRELDAEGFEGPGVQGFEGP